MNFEALSDEQICRAMAEECDVSSCEILVKKLTDLLGEADAKNVDVFVALVTASIATLALGTGIAPERSGLVVAALAAHLSQAMGDTLREESRVAN